MQGSGHDSDRDHSVRLEMMLQPWAHWAHCEQLFGQGASESSTSKVLGSVVVGETEELALIAS